MSKTPGSFLRARRFAAFFVDLLILFGVSYLVLKFPRRMPSLFAESSLHLSLTIIVVSVAAIEAVAQTSPGKALFRLRIAGDPDVPLPKLRIGARTILFWIVVLAPQSVIPGSIIPVWGRPGDVSTIVGLLAASWSILLLPVVTSGWSEGRTGIHDVLTRTMVVSKPNLSPAADIGDSTRPGISKAIISVCVMWILFTVVLSLTFYSNNAQEQLDARVARYGGLYEAVIKELPSGSGSQLVTLLATERIPVFPVAVGAGLPYSTLKVRFPISINDVKLKQLRDWHAFRIVRYIRQLEDVDVDALHLQLVASTEFGFAKRVFTVNYAYLPFLSPLVPYAPSIVGVRRKGDQEVLPRDSVTVMDADSAYIRLGFEPEVEERIILNWPFGGWKVGSFDFTPPPPSATPDMYEDQGLIRFTFDDYQNLPALYRDVPVRMLVAFESGKYRLP